MLPPTVLGLHFRVGAAGSPPPCELAKHRVMCAWTHFHSRVDGTREGAPSYFELPLAANKYYLSVYAPRTNAEEHDVRGELSYRLLVLTDIGAFPRPGLQGRVVAKTLGELTVDVRWEQATFVPSGVSRLLHYQVPMRDFQGWARAGCRNFVGFFQRIA